MVAIQCYMPCLTIDLAYWPLLIKSELVSLIKIGWLCCCCFFHIPCYKLDLECLRVKELCMALFPALILCYNIWCSWLIALLKAAKYVDLLVLWSRLWFSWLSKKASISLHKLFFYRRVLFLLQKTISSTKDTSLAPKKKKKKNTKDTNKSEELQKNKSMYRKTPTL